jgi:hypothetical protein
MTAAINPYRRLSPRADESGLVNVVIDTPRGSANRYKYDEQLDIFKISRVLPAGINFPHDFGSVPGTRAEDGDPLDVLVLLESPSFAGCLGRASSGAACRAIRKTSQGTQGPPDCSARNRGEQAGYTLFTTARAVAPARDRRIIRCLQSRTGANASHRFAVEPSHGACARGSGSTGGSGIRPAAPTPNPDCFESSDHLMPRRRCRRTSRAISPAL